MGREQKRVYQYNKYNKQYIAEYESLSEASATTGIDKGNISKNCNGDLKTVDDYIFSYSRIANKNNSKTKLDKRYKEMYTVIDNQYIEMFTWNNNKIDQGYYSYLDEQLKELDNIYSNVQDEEEAIDLIYKQFTKFYTFFDYDIYINKNSRYKNKTQNRNPHLRA